MCHVVMDEAGVGKDAAGLRMSDETLMHRGHDLWLATWCRAINFKSMLKKRQSMLNLHQNRHAS
jgi:hypothetical protein